LYDCWVCLQVYGGGGPVTGTLDCKMCGEFGSGQGFGSITGQGLRRARGQILSVCGMGGGARCEMGCEKVVQGSLTARFSLWISELSHVLTSHHAAPQPIEWYWVGQLVP